MNDDSSLNDYDKRVKQFHAELKKCVDSQFEQFDRDQKISLEVSLLGAKV